MHRSFLSGAPRQRAWPTLPHRTLTFPARVLLTSCRAPTRPGLADATQEIVDEVSLVIRSQLGKRLAFTHGSLPAMTRAARIGGRFQDLRAS